MEMDAKQLEAWLRLSADAVRGAGQAKEAIQMLGQGPVSPDAMAAWMQAWMPQAGGATGAAKPAESPPVEEFQGVVEEWWKGLGVVPRSRYLEAVRLCEELRARLEEAEQTVKHLRELLAAGGHEAEATEALDTLDTITRKALDAQAEWARMFVERRGGTGTR
ncbi:MAG TPA: hypothetical protein VFE20_08665 [Thermoleophilia bacterium]|nr:hypothetical protein [Thermoleophilia bacterium]